MNKRHISDFEFESILATWRRNGELDKLRYAFKIEQKYAIYNKRITRVDLLERVNNKFKY